jgi:HEAT repeat protein
MASVVRPALPAEPGERLLILIPSLTGEGTPVDRRQAALDILQLGTDESVKAIAGILSLKNNAAAKLAICEALAELETIPPGLADPLFGLLQQQKEQVLRDGAVAALYRFSDSSVSQRLRDFLEQEELRWLRTENVARSRELYALLPRESDRVARLQTWLKAAQPLDRLTALEIIHSAMLATIPTPPAKEVLQQIRLMLRDPDESVRRKLVVVLRDLQEKDDASRIVAMLDHERSPVVLEEIYKALGRMGAVEAVSACIAGLQSSNDKVASGAADALGRLCRKVNGNAPSRNDDVVAALLTKASTPIEDAVLRGQVIGAMAAIAAPKFLPVLLSHAGPDEKVPQIRQAALTGLGEIGEPANLDLIIARLSEDSDAGVREAAAEALGKTGSKPTHLRPLFLRLSDPSQAVQVRAWQAYRQLFARLSWTERKEVLTGWTANDKATNTRRIDLLTDLESQASTAISEPAELVCIREDLGDTLVAVAEYALAAAAYARATEGPEQGSQSAVLTSKLLDAYLHVPAHDKALALAAAAKSPQMAAVMAERLLAYVQDLAKIDGRAAAECIDRFKAGAPALFNGECGADLDQVRQSASQPAGTHPAAN